MKNKTNIGRVKIAIMQTLAKFLGLRPTSASATWQWAKGGDRCKWGLACELNGSNPRLWVKSLPKDVSRPGSVQMMILSRKGVWISNW